MDKIIARYEGEYAFAMGDGESRNPYPRGSIAWERWRDGWREAQQRSAGDELTCAS